MDWEDYLRTSTPEIRPACPLQQVLQTFTCFKELPLEIHWRYKYASGSMPSTQSGPIGKLISRTARWAVIYHFNRYGSLNCIGYDGYCDFIQIMYLESILYKWRSALPAITPEHHTYKSFIRFAREVKCHVYAELKEAPFERRRLMGTCVLARRCALEAWKEDFKRYRKECHCWRAIRCALRREWRMAREELLFLLEELVKYVSLHL